MKYHNRPAAALMLEDGTIFRGTSVGAIGTTTGEIAFNTGMTGYQEIFTDPSYFGQILVMTVAHIGNYGVHESEVESANIQISGLVCKNFSDFYSRPSAVKSLHQYFQEQGKVGISGVDTRALVRHIRTTGAMNAVISSDKTDIDFLREALKHIPEMSGLMLADKVSTSRAYEVGSSSAQFRVAVIDYGVKTNILRCLTERDCQLKVFPYSANVSEIMEWEPDGIMLSNGPGDPSAMEDQVDVVRELHEIGIPIFGICLGHQILSIAAGLTTKKMHHGHRGINHPIKNLLTGKCEITSQNHGFVVDFDSATGVSSAATISHQHLNDGSLAGLQINGTKSFSVQFHPESSAGPNDSRYLFDMFIQNIKTRKSAIV
jgi:carbamoyl-phosphate synthase small subunit